MKIGIDARLWNESGVGRYIRNLVFNLEVLDRKNDYVVFVRSDDLNQIEDHELRIRNGRWRLVVADARWHSIDEQLKFPAIINREKLDLMHFPYFSYPYLYRGKFVITIHDLILNHFPTGKASSLPGFIYRFKLEGYKFLVNSAAARAEKIIAVSKATKKEIVEDLHVNPQKIVVTYEGIDMKIKNPTSSTGRQKIKVRNENGDYFLYVGNAYPHKNLERLIEAFKQFRLKIPTSSTGRQESGIKLIFVGKEDFFYKRLKQTVSAKDGIEFLGFVSDRELASLYQNAMAVIAPSLMEGFGLPALEAMSEGALVLASNIASFHEVCGDCAVYFDPFSIDSIAEKISDVYTHRKDYAYKKKQGLERAKKFSWERMARETLSVYESCVSVRSGE